MTSAARDTLDLAIHDHWPHVWVPIGWTAISDPDDWPRAEQLAGSTFVRGSSLHVAVQSCGCGDYRFVETPVGDADSIRAHLVRARV